MKFLLLMEEKLAQRLDKLNFEQATEEEVKRWAIETILESYQNSEAAGKKATAVKPQGISARRLRRAQKRPDTESR